MKSAALALVLSTVACAHARAGEVEHHMERAEMQALLEGVYAAMGSERLAELLDLYAEDAIIQSAGEGPVMGKRAIEQFWRETFASFHVKLTPAVEECTALGEVVVVRGRATGSFEPKGDGVPKPIDSWFLQVYRRGADGSVRFWRGSNGPLAAAR